MLIDDDVRVCNTSCVITMENPCTTYFISDEIWDDLTNTPDKLIGYVHYHPDSD